jgi:hypothetical protein
MLRHHASQPVFGPPVAPLGRWASSPPFHYVHLGATGAALAHGGPSQTYSDLASGDSVLQQLQQQLPQRPLSAEQPGKPGVRPLKAPAAPLDAIRELPGAEALQTPDEVDDDGNVGYEDYGDDDDDERELVQALRESMRLNREQMARSSAMAGGSTYEDDMAEALKLSQLGT